MCLDSVDYPTKKAAVAYKVFKRVFTKDGADPSVFKSLIYPDVASRKLGSRITHNYYEEGVWYKDVKNFTLLSWFDDKPYDTGFHCFKFESDAKRYAKSRLVYRRYVIKKVHLETIVASGRQDGAPVVVAKEMFICPEGW
jgi:hypothetical protein